MATLPQWIEARVIQKIATEAEWNEITLVPYKGEVCLVGDNGGKVVNIKIGDGINVFSDLEYMFDSIQQNVGYIAIESNALPTPLDDVAWGMVTGGTYTFGGSDVFTVPDGHWGIANYSSGVWSLVDMGELPESSTILKPWIEGEVNINESRRVIEHQYVSISNSNNDDPSDEDTNKWIGIVGVDSDYNLISNNIRGFKYVKEIYIDYSQFDTAYFGEDFDFSNLYKVVLHGLGFNSPTSLQIEIRFYDSESTFKFVNAVSNIQDGGVDLAQNRGVKIYSILERDIIGDLTYNLNINLNKPVIFNRKRNELIDSYFKYYPENIPDGVISKNKIKEFIETNPFYILPSNVTVLQQRIVGVLKEVFLQNSTNNISNFRVWGFGVNLVSGNIRILLAFRKYIGTQYIEYYGTRDINPTSTDDLITNILYNPSNSTLPDDGSSVRVLIDVETVKKIHQEGGQPNTYGDFIRLNISRLLDKSYSLVMKNRDSSGGNEDTLVDIFKYDSIISEYLPNPNNGLSTNAGAVAVNNSKHIVKSSVISNLDTTSNRYAFISDLIDDSGIDINGNLNQENIVLKTESFFNSFIDSNRNTRWIIKYGSCWNPSGGGLLVDDDNSPNGKSYVWMPLNMYNYLKENEPNSLITVYSGYATLSQTQYVCILDYRNAKVLSILDNIFSAFVEYLDKPAVSPGLQSSNNFSTSIKKGDFIAAIQIRPVGPWGEGNTSDDDNETFYPYTSSIPLIDVVELYKKHFLNYILLAPTFGTRASKTTEVFYEFQHYLLTTSYGNTSPNVDGRFEGNKKFGMFIDHMTNNDTRNDFTISYNGQSLKNIAIEKYKEAQVAGENGNNNDIGSSIYYFDYWSKIYRYSNIIFWGQENRWSNIGLDSFSDVLSKIGYKIGVIYNRCGKTSSEITGSIDLYNLGRSYLYDDFWIFQFVVRDKEDGSLINVIDNSISLKEISKKCRVDNYLDVTNLYNLPVNISISSQDVNLFIRIVDSKHINENMFLFNKGRTSNGEYCILSSEYSITYELDGGVNNPNNTMSRTIYEDMILYPAYKMGFSFDGWYFDSSFTMPISHIDVDNTDNITVYAKYV